MNVLAIDPGSEQSAYVLWDGCAVHAHGKRENCWLLESFQRNRFAFGDPYPMNPHVVFEQIASYGMPVGSEVFQTVFWTGRFWQVADDEHCCYLLPRRDVKLHLCGQVRAKDANIRQALIDRFGGKDKAIGRKAAPGPLYGLKADEWQALALAVTFHDQAVSQSSVAEAEAL